MFNIIVEISVDLGIANVEFKNSKLKLFNFYQFPEVHGSIRFVSVLRGSVSERFGSVRFAILSVSCFCGSAVRVFGGHPHPSSHPIQFLKVFFPNQNVSIQCSHRSKPPDIQNI